MFMTRNEQLDINYSKPVHFSAQNWYRTHILKYLLLLNFRLYEVLKRRSGTFQLNLTTECIHWSKMNMCTNTLCTIKSDIVIRISCSVVVVPQ